MSSTTPTNTKPFIWPTDNPFKWSFSNWHKIKIEALVHKKMPQFKGEDVALYPEAAEWYTVPDPEDFMMWGKSECWVEVDDIKHGSDTLAITKYYSPLSGRFSVLKTFTDEDRSCVFQVYKLLANKPHCVPWLATGKNKILEPFYPTTLNDAIDKFNTTKAKVEAIHQLAKGLSAIHSIEYTNNVYQKDHQLSLVGTLSHRDLKANNIFGSWTSENQFTFLIGDYGRVGELALKSTYVVASPEAARIYLLPEVTERDLILFHHQGGPQLDLWQLGMQISAILNGKISPFNWQREIWNRSDYRVAERISQLTQSTVDLEVDEAIQKIPPEDKALLKTWKMVKKYLLRVNPHERRDMSYILKKISKIQLL